MLTLKRVNGTTFYLNAMMIELIEATPDTVITLVSGHKYVVAESVSEVLQQIAEYYRTIGLVGVAASQVGDGHLK